MSESNAASSIVFRNGLILTMDDRGTVLKRADVLVVGEHIAEIGADLAVPEGTRKLTPKAASSCRA